MPNDRESRELRESRAVSPLDVLMGQALALRHMADAMVLAIESLSVRSPAGAAAADAMGAAPGPTRPPHGIAEPPPVIPPGQSAPGAPRGFPTFDGPVTIPGAAVGSPVPPTAPAAPAREIAPDDSGDLHPTTE